MKPILTVVLLACSLLVAQEKSEQKDLQVLTFKTKKETAQFMKTVVAKGLGVKCSFCHNPNDPPSDEKEHKRIAREMLRMVQSINTITLQKLELQPITCWNCHRGEKQTAHQP